MKMNKSDYILAFILSIGVVVWGLFSVHIFLSLVALLIPRQLRFTVLYFGFLSILLSIGIVEETNLLDDDVHKCTLTYTSEHSST